MKQSEYVAALGLALLFTLGGFLLARTSLPSRAERLRNLASQTVGQLTTEPETILASAIDQRYRTSHEALAAMRRDLTRLVSVESTFIADSAYPTVYLLPPYAYSASPGNWVTIQVERDGWSAVITSNHTPIRCTVSVRISGDLRTGVSEPIACVGAHTPLPE